MEKNNISTTSGRLFAPSSTPRGGHSTCYVIGFSWFYTIALWVVAAPFSTWFGVCFAYRFYWSQVLPDLTRSVVFILVKAPTCPRSRNISPSFCHTLFVFHRLGVAVSASATRCGTWPIFVSISHPPSGPSIPHGRLFSFPSGKFLHFLFWSSLVGWKCHSVSRHIIRLDLTICHGFFIAFKS